MVVQIPFDDGVGLVRGDNFPKRYYVTGIKGVTVTSGRLTVKTALSDADPGVFQKAITSSNVAGTGQIEDTGANGIATLRFDITTANTEALTADTDYFYDVQVVLSDSQVLTLVKGVIRATEQVSKTNT